MRDGSRGFILFVKMIWAKKRFTILQRDWFRCSYCGKNWKDVTLEIDHIIPKSNWWSDNIENLTTCCRECNIGKWWKEIQEHSKDLYKEKLKDAVKELKNHLYQLWNNKYKLGTIDNKTVALISIYCSDAIMWSDNVKYKSYLDYPPLYWKWSPYWEDWKNVDVKKMDVLFQKWGEFCDDIISCILWEEKMWVNCIFEDDILEDDHRTNKDAPMYSRLNYQLWYLLKWEVSDYVLRKYVLSYKSLCDD